MTESQSDDRSCNQRLWVLILMLRITARCCSLLTLFFPLAARSGWFCSSQRMRTKPGRLGARDERSEVRVGGRSGARQVQNGFLFGARAALLRTARKGSYLSRPPERKEVEKARECEPAPYWEGVPRGVQHRLWGNPGICAARQYTRMSIVQRA